MDYQFKVSESIAWPTLAVRTRTAVARLPQVLGQTYDAIYQYMQEIGERPIEAAYAAYHNMDMSDLEVEIGFVAAKPLPGRGKIIGSEIPGGKRASVMYKGPYNQMESVYQAFNDWMAANHHTPTGVVYELYYNDPSQVPESELLTRIVFPLKA
ncbi:MAG: GyrI-like domain-containing protein [Syntrophomonadaceae bacterium]|nr:GyrI-like domain-containing protein [Syntrophomonadaceae bacterium]